MSDIGWLLLLKREDLPIWFTLNDSKPFFTIVILWIINNWEKLQADQSIIKVIVSCSSTPLDKIKHLFQEQLGKIKLHHFCHKFQFLLDGRDYARCFLALYFTLCMCAKCTLVFLRPGASSSPVVHFKQCGIRENILSYIVSGWVSGCDKHVLSHYFHAL